MATKAELQSLLERVENATGPDRDIDSSIVRAIVPDCVIDTYVQGDDELSVFHAQAIGIPNKGSVPAYTSSIDAALALVERVLPGKHCRLGIGYAGDYSSADLGKAGRLCRWSCDGFAERPDNELPLAILAALIGALIAQADADLPPR